MGGQLFNFEGSPYCCSIHIAHISSFLIFQIDKELSMFINFRSSEAVHANLLQEAFHSFDENKGFFKLIAMDGPIISES